jgi:hypothetical protein
MKDGEALKDPAQLLRTGQAYLSDPVRWGKDNGHLLSGTPDIPSHPAPRSQPKVS